MRGYTTQEPIRQVTCGGCLIGFPLGTGIHTMRGGCLHERRPDKVTPYPENVSVRTCGPSLSEEQRFKDKLRMSSDDWKARVR